MAAEIQRSTTLSEAELLEYTPPHNTDAEQAVLGSILTNNELWYEINTTIAIPDFYNVQHQIIYEALLQLFYLNKVADVLTLTEQLTAQNNLEKVGGKAYLVEMMANVPAAVNISHYADIVRTKSVMRQLYAIGQKISQMAYDPASQSATAILDEAEQLVFSIAEQQQKGKTGLLPIGDVLVRLNEKLKELWNSPHKNITGLETGFYDLDNKTAGLQPGDLIIVAGRPSMGKTSFAMNIAEYAAVDKERPVAIFSMEMPADQVVTRMVSSLAQIELSKLKTADFNETDWDKFRVMYERLHQAKIFIDESGDLTALEIKAKIRRLKRQYPDLALVVVDYIQLMSGSGKSDNRTMELGEISRTLKTLAKEIKAPIIVLSQLSRGVETRGNKRPVMSDLRDSGAIEQDADLIMFMYRDSYYNSDNEDSGPRGAPPLHSEAEVIIAKHRNGPVGTVHLYFESEFTKFVNATNTDYPASF